MIDLYFLISAVVAQFFNPTAELVISTETSSNEEKKKRANTETQPLNQEN